MSYIKIVGDTNKYHAKLLRMNDHLIKVVGLDKTLNGFRVFLDNGDLIGDYTKFKYEYNQPNLGDGVFMYSDDNREYKPPKTEEELKEDRKQEILEVIDDYMRKNFVQLFEESQEIQDMIIDIYENLSVSKECTDKDTQNEDTTNNENGEE